MLLTEPIYRNIRRISHKHMNKFTVFSGKRLTDKTAPLVAVLAHALVVFMTFTWGLRLGWGLHQGWGPPTKYASLLFWLVAAATIYTMSHVRTGSRVRRQSKTGQSCWTRPKKDSSSKCEALRWLIIINKNVPQRVRVGLGLRLG